MALVNIVLYCSKAESRVSVIVGGGGGMQVHFHVKLKFCLVELRLCCGWCFDNIYYKNIIILVVLQAEKLHTS